MQRLSQQLMASPPHSPIDQIYEQRLSLGRIQYLYILILSLIDLNDGIEIMIMSIVLPIIKKEMGLTANQLPFVQFIFNFGMFMGAMASGYLADKWGRKKVIQAASFVQGCIAFSFICKIYIYGDFIFNLIIFYLKGVSGYQMFNIMRFFYGIVYGLSLPLSTSLFTEISP